MKQNRGPAGPAWLRWCLFTAAALCMGLAVTGAMQWISIGTYVPENKLAQYKNKANYTGKVNDTVSAPKVETVDGDFVVYTVRNGENL